MVCRLRYCLDVLFILLFASGISLVAGGKRAKVRRRHRKLLRAGEESAAIPNSYLVSLDPRRVVSAQEAVERLVRQASAAASNASLAGPVTVDFIYQGHAVLGFEISHVDDWLLNELLESLDVIFVEENQRASLLQEEVLEPHEAELKVQAIQDERNWGLDYVSWPLDSMYVYQQQPEQSTYVAVYILDTGIYLNHEEFLPNRAECAFEVMEEGTNCEDFHGHGTHVASIVGGVYYGVAKNANLKAVKVVDRDGGGSMGTVVAGIDWVIADLQSMQKTSERSISAIINLSVGGGVSTMLNEAIDRATESGILVVGAAGNRNGEDACEMSPPSSTNCLAVGALTNRSRQADFSNVGPCIDIWAPGAEILGAGIKEVDSVSIRTGTSQASPFVTGLASLYMERGLSADEAREALLRDARVVNDLTRGNSPPLAAYSGPISTQSDPIVTDTLPATELPSSTPTVGPSLPLSEMPTRKPTEQPSKQPTDEASLRPSLPMTSQPLVLPTSFPTHAALYPDVSVFPSFGPSEYNSLVPSMDSESQLELISEQPSVSEVIRNYPTDFPSSGQSSQPARIRQGPQIDVQQPSFPELTTGTPRSVPSDILNARSTGSRMSYQRWTQVQTCLFYMIKLTLLL